MSTTTWSGQFICYGKLIASELLTITRRRSELAACIHGFLAMEHAAGSDLHCTRAISAALLSQSLETEALAEATRTAAGAWRLRYEGLVAGQIES